LRLFVAVNLPATVRETVYDALAPVRRAVPEVRWTKPESLHVTLMFLGDTDEAKCDAVITALAAAARRHSPFRIAIEDVDAFPSLRRPSIWILRVADGGALRLLQAAVERALVPLGFAADERPFTPHITIGRARGRRGSTPAQAPPVRTRRRAEVAVETVDLMKSQTGADGARYELLAAAPLAGE
jgi:2'-5' RNA ligase